MAMTKREGCRYRAIVNELARLSRNGWTRDTHVDFEPLEAELSRIADKMLGGASWYCDQCHVEVYQVRCQHCGKTERESKYV